MKTNKTIFCLIAALVMLSVCVSALQSEPDAQGNVVCSGQYTTKYNPEKLNAIMRGLSDSSIVSEDTELAKCLEDGKIRLSYRPLANEGAFIDFAEIYGTVAANSATNKIDITDGWLIPLEAPEGRRHVGLIGKAITLQFVKDAQQKIKPMFRLSKDGAYLAESVFFGCLQKDERGMSTSCAMSGQLYKEGDSERYLTITGQGFVGESVFAEAYDMVKVYVTEHPNNIKELKEKARLMPEDEFVAIPLMDLEEVKVTKRTVRNTDTLNLQAKAQAETSAVDSIKVKSDKEVTILDFIEGYRPNNELIANVGSVAISSDGEDVKVIASPERLKEGAIFWVLARDAKASIFVSQSKLADVFNEISIYPETAERAYELTILSSIMLKSGNKEIKIRNFDDNMDIRLLPGYETVTITPMLENGLMQGSVKVTNPANGAWILYANDELTWTQGKSIKDLGFNFNINLNPAAADESEMLSCTTDGICWLGDTMVVGLTPSGLTQEKLEKGIDNARRSAPARTAEEGAKGTGDRCESDADCGNEDYMCYKRPGTADRYGICRYSSAPDRRSQQTLTCQEAGGRCKMSCGISESSNNAGTGCGRPEICCISMTMGLKAASEIPPFAECEIDSECGPIEKCSGGRCFKKCVDNLDCPPSLVCKEGVCFPGCDTDADCITGRRCIERLCVRSLPAELPPFDEGAKSAEETRAQCGRCGAGIFNICDEDECNELGSCYFQKRAVGGSCHAYTSSTPRQLSGEEFEEVVGAGDEGAKGVGDTCETDDDCGSSRYACEKGAGARYGICIPAGAARRNEETCRELGGQCRTLGQCGESRTSVFASGCRSDEDCCVSRAAGAKGIIGEGSEDTLGQKCDTDEDCGAAEQCDLRERVCVLQEQRAQGAKTAQDNACAAAGGRCRDRCYFDSEERTTSGAANDACFLTPIAGQPIETRRCCIPKEQEGQNACEILGGTCKAGDDCDFSTWGDFWGTNTEYIASPEINIESCGTLYEITYPATISGPSYKYNRGTICCAPR